MVDIDNLDATLKRFATRLCLPLGDHATAGVPIQIASLEDFHPDRIVPQLELFSELRNVRQRLQDSSTFAAAAAEVQTWAGPVQAPAAPRETTAPAATGSTQPESDAATVERLLGRPKTQASASPLRNACVDLQSLLREAVAPHIVRGPDPRQAELVAAVDAAIADQLRRIVHHPDFQAMEAAWRGLDFLVHNLELDESLKLFVLDASREELAADLGSTDDLRSTALHRLLVQSTIETPGGEPWSLIVANHQFDRSTPDAAVLGRLAQLAAAAGAPVLAGAASTLVSEIDQASETTQGDREMWTALRQLPEAAYLGFSLPRFLLRLPYGRKTDPVHAFEFEEITDPASGVGYLWGNSALLCATMLGQSFTQSGWDLSPGDIGEVSGLPLHVYKDAEGSKMTPCAEMWLTDGQAEALLEAGFMPVMSILSRDAVRLPRFQSIRDPLCALAGRWA